ncbi:lytic transglycosylase domain-containing protein [Aquifex aeolicus]|uniref:Transglycosylase SLT domain-containing protein n=1 Tax=Aquifex aeolicus (strain VF5) TaxID=224324 RepID=O67414_AQUAE|nr:lytic transglycosylase domain-containing protein [Aquifex aeolicus]AAC07380.1 hypothetical protein aq_1420 [Aquifex aeolicus VF5]
MLLFLTIILILVGGCTPKTKEVVLKNRNYVVIKEGKPALSEEDIIKLSRSLYVNKVNRPEVLRALKSLLTKRESLKYAFYRMKLYENIIVPILRSYGLPEEFKYLPIVESMYNPFAVSRSGAAGIWQLMPQTARRYGLIVRKDYDERFDVVKSTHAAAKYLRDLLEEFKNLELVLAAYNCGENCIRRNVNYNFWKERRKLPKETQNYVPLFLATLLIAQNPEYYGIHLYEPSREIAIVKVGIPMSVEDFLIMYSMNESRFRDLNPHIRGRKIPKNANVYVEERKLVKGEYLLRARGREE